MNSWQIEKVLHRDPIVARFFVGCFPANKIPKKPTSPEMYPFCGVLNTDIAGQPGTHWVAIFACTPSRIEYFDSFALPPNSFIVEYLKQFPVIVQSKLPLQTPGSTACGRYTIYFLTKRCEGFSFEGIMKHLLLNCKSHPNNIVNSFLARRFDVGTNISL